MNKSELIDAIAADAGLSKADAGKALDATLSAVTGALKGGDSVSLVGFGTFQVKDRAARSGRNPQQVQRFKFAPGSGFKAESSKEPLTGGNQGASSGPFFESTGHSKTCFKIFEITQAVSLRKSSSV